jgi:prepilin-type N-terminal cleavage/methylation domain-containing protein
VRAPRGFTLLEILTALALATLVYALVSSTNPTRRSCSFAAIGWSAETEPPRWATAS